MAVMGGMIAMLGAAAGRFAAFGLLAAVHSAIIAAVGAATVRMSFMAALLVPGMIGMVLTMLAMVFAMALALRRLIMTLMLGRGGLSGGRGRDDERHCDKDDLHRDYLRISLI